uniref:Uncharacterized protein n=1 Tax=Labrus bergylta TaxID=56723 RepID=A0A3Q3F154_9LABR
VEEYFSTYSLLDRLQTFYDASADSSAEFPDRASMMEVRLQAQEDEITLLKSSLADALRRIPTKDSSTELSIFFFFQASNT